MIMILWKMSDGWHYINTWKHYLTASVHSERVGFGPIQPVITFISKSLHPKVSITLHYYTNNPNPIWPEQFLIVFEIYGVKLQKVIMYILVAIHEVIFISSIRLVWYYNGFLMFWGMEYDEFLATLFRPSDFIFPKGFLNYLAFKYFGFECTQWKLFQKRIVPAKFNICVFIDRG